MSAKGSAHRDSASRYVLGLDLGTTNCAVAYLDTAEATEDAAPPVRTFGIPQLVEAGEVGTAPLLPSFIYLPGAGEFDADKLAVPWGDAKQKQRTGPQAVGRFAREHGGKVPTRLVASSKSWLCHAGVDRKGPVLPWAAGADFGRRISPLEAAERFLGHLRDTWNAEHTGKDETFEDQEIVLTVPASFDAVARELTAEAARNAGLKQVTLFEEPQAAFYAWLHHTGDDWRRHVAAGDVTLVVDVGGGTTDLTLIGVADEQGDLTLTRIAVGEHLLLGGDNMDLALAQTLAAGLREEGHKLDTVQLLGLWHACRAAKETLLADPDAKDQPITVLGRGSKVVGGTMKTTLSRATVEKRLLDGFLPKTDADATPARRRETGLQEIGLDYAADPAITRHLAEFLRLHADAIAGYRTQDADAAEGANLPTSILFNGGVFNADPLRERVLATVRGWGDGDLTELPSRGMDLAVSVGAAAYGWVRRGHGVRIRGGVPRSYYIGVESSMPAVPGMPAPLRALCVVPKGMEEGTEAPPLDTRFGLLVGEEATFRFLGSTVRPDDTVGTLIDDWQDDIDELAPIQTTLEADGAAAGQVVPVQLHSRVTEVGTLELWCQSADSDRRWKLEFNVRDPVES